MSDACRILPDLPPEQEAVRAKCFHPSGDFIEFKKEEVEQSITERFQQQVAKYPDRLAVKVGKDAFTYEGLNKAANPIARAILNERGEGEERVALLLENDAPIIAAMLGVLKAGKTYVPLDPSFPRARTTYILEDSQIALVVTDTKYAPLVKELAHGGVRLLNVDELDDGPPTENLKLSISPDTLAWIIYTSGSTGQPKGVIQNHRNVLHWIMNYTNDFHISAEDRLTLLFSPSFGTAVLDIFGALLNGAALYPFNLKKEGPGRLAARLIGESITFYHSVPAVFRYFLDTVAGEETFPDVRLINLDGESVSREEVELYKKYFSLDCILVNRLGSAETGSVRSYFIGKETEISGHLIPVGYAVEDMELLLLNDDGEAIGLGGIGEISVRSRYLSPGYWRRPDLTRAAFLPSPTGAEERVYLSGDLGRMRPNGCLEYLGRKDSRLKIRGYRIEIAEIEMALMALENVKEAVVEKKEQGEEKVLVAYVVPVSKKPSPTVTALRRALKEKLPDYMVPSAFVLLETLPLTPNGKVDRRALPMPDGSRPELEEAFVAPRTPVEEMLAKIWAEMLGLDQVGIHDNFFDLGGHSLLATQVVSRIRSAFNLELPLRSLFEKPTVAALAAAIMQGLADNAESNRTADILTRIESLSDEEAQRLLSDENR